MSSLLAAELSATCSALGYHELTTDKYHADENVLETLKDLIRYLRRDEDTRDVRRQLGETNVLVTDLLPLLKSYWEQDELFDVLLRLLVNLTTPPLILWEEEIPSDRVGRNYYLQIQDHLQRYKEAFTDDGIWAILCTKLSKILELDYTERGEEKGLVIERILILVRNVLYVPSDEEKENRPDNDANLHDQVLWALRQSGMLDIVLYMASSNSEQVYYLHLIELLSFLLREQTPETLANAGLERNHLDKQEDETRLQTVRLQENREKREKLKKFNGARHSRFGGTFIVKSMKAIGENELIYHKPLNTIDKLDFDSHKNKQKTPKNRLPIKSTKTERHSAFVIRLFLKEFCVEFLNGAYNTFMHHIIRILLRSGTDTHDESYYFWVLKFFMEFNRLCGGELKLITETISKEMFHYCQQRMEHHFDMLSSDKKKMALWSKRLHLALLAYRELLLTLSTMDKSNDPSIKESARIIKCNIFYIIEYRELVLTLLITFDELKMSDVYLKDLIETQHIFLKMLEIFCKQTGGVVIAQKKKGRRKKKIAKNITTLQTNHDLWDEITSDLSAILANRDTILPEVIPADFTLPIEEQKVEAMKNIDKALKTKELETAVALLRTCRQLWPENDIFGKNQSPPEEEYLIFQEIFFSQLTEAQNQTQQNNDDDEEEEEEFIEDDFSEVTLQFDDFAKRLAHPKIVRACSLCLKNFTQNSTFTNHCIIKLLHRIAFDLKMYVMLFQASIFRIFQQIFTMKELPQYKELVKFSTYIMRQFFRIAEINKKVFMETLFWKNSKEAIEIEEGYGTTHKTANRAWSEIEENEIRTLHEEFLNKEIEENVVDWVHKNLIDQTKSRKAVMKKMRELGLLNNYPTNNKRNNNINKIWTETEENELQDLFEQFKNTDDPLTEIIANFSVDKPKNRIVEKLLVMGLISDKSELRKKRQKKKKETKKIKRKQQPQINLQSTLFELKQNNFEEALKWLSETLLEAADDLENASEVETDGGVPIVPLLEYCEAAFEDETFKKLLLGLGLWEPTDEQVYWRIPNSTEPETLRNSAEIIANVPDGIEENENETAIERTEENDKLNSDTETHKRITFNSSSSSTSNTDDDDDDNDPANNQDNDLNEDIHVGLSLSRNLNFDSSDDETSQIIDSEAKRLREDSGSDVESPKPEKKRKKIMVLSSDEE